MSRTSAGKQRAASNSAKSAGVTYAEVESNLGNTFQMSGADAKGTRGPLAALRVGPLPHPLSAIGSRLHFGDQHMSEFSYCDSDAEAHYDALMAIARALRNLGNADAATPMGAIEAHGAVMQTGLESVASAASTIGEALYSISVSIDAHAEAVTRLAAALEKAGE